MYGTERIKVLCLIIIENVLFQNGYLCIWTRVHDVFTNQNKQRLIGQLLTYVRHCVDEMQKIDTYSKSGQKGTLFLQTHILLSYM